MIARDGETAGPVAPAAAVLSRARTLREMLLFQPMRFGLDAAAAVMMRAAGRPDPGDAIRFHAQTGLGFVASDVSAVAVEGDRFHATIGLLGLTGPSGVLPRPYTELVNGERRRRSPALGAFLDLLAQRPIAQFVQAGIKYRPHRTADAAAIGSEVGRDPPADGMRNALLALTGYGTPGLGDRLATGTDPLLYHAGLFAARPRSADRLGALLSDWLEQPVEIEQFAGRWIRLDRTQRSLLPASGADGRFNQLGTDAVAGGRSWDIQSRIIVRIGPLDGARFASLMPGGRLLPRLIALVRAYLDGEVDFAVRPILAADAVPSLRLDRSGCGRLGWNSWLPAHRPRQRDAEDALFAADLALRSNGASGDRP